MSDGEAPVERDTMAGGGYRQLPAPEPYRPADARPKAPPGPTGWRREVWTFVELFAMCGFALTQPLLAVFGDGVEQFAFRGATRGHVIAFGLLVTFLPAVVLWAIEAATTVLGAEVRRVVHVGLLAALAAITFIQVIRSVVTGPLLIVAALAFFPFACYAFSSWSSVRLWARFAALAPLGFLLLFLTSSRSAALLNETTAAYDVTVGAPAPVVMLTLDELPLASLLDEDGSIDEELYPNFAALAGDSHWFRNTTTSSTATWYAVPTILSGSYPEEGNSPVAADYDETLFTLLGNTYDLRVTETITRMCPSALCSVDQARANVMGGLWRDVRRVMGQRLSPSESTDDPVAGFADDSEVPEFSGTEQARFQELMDSLDGAGPTTLHYAHLLLPHIPFTWLPSGHNYMSPNPDVGRLVDEDEWTDDAWPPVLGRQRHVLQLQYLDGLIGQLVADLKERDLYDDALVVVVADHGASFEAGETIRALRGQSLDQHRRADLLWIPFFVKEPGQAEGQIHDANVQTIDVVPTIADVLDVEIPFEVDGQSALGPPRSTSDKTYIGNRTVVGGYEQQDPVTFDGAADWPVVLERSVGTFLPGVGDRWRQWRLGPAPELVGVPVAEAPAGRLRGISGPIEDFGDGALVLVRGRPEGVPAGTPMAIAIDGVIGGTGTTYLERDGSVAFAVMIDEPLFSNRNPDIGLYVLE